MAFYFICPLQLTVSRRLGCEHLNRLDNLRPTNSHNLADAKNEKREAPTRGTILSVADGMYNGLRAHHYNLAIFRLERLLMESI